MKEMMELFKLTLRNNKEKIIKVNNFFIYLVSTLLLIIYLIYIDIIHLDKKYNNELKYASITTTIIAFFNLVIYKLVSNKNYRKE